MYRNGLKSNTIMINYDRNHHSPLKDHCVIKGEDDKQEGFTRKLKEIIKQITPNEKESLKETFEILNDDPMRRGACVYVKLFQDYPEYKNLWPQLRCISDSLLFGHTLLDQLGVIYCNGLKEIVNSMDDDERLSYQMEKIAYKHHIKHVTRAHLEHMLPKLIETLEMASGRPMNEEVQEAWRKLFNAVASIIELFHDKYLLEKRRDVLSHYNPGRAYH